MLDIPYKSEAATLSQCRLCPWSLCIKISNGRHRRKSGTHLADAEHLRWCPLVLHREHSPAGQLGLLGLVFRPCCFAASFCPRITLFCVVYSQGFGYYQIDDSFNLGSFPVSCHLSPVPPVMILAVLLSLPVHCVLETRSLVCHSSTTHFLSAQTILSSLPIPSGCYAAQASVNLLTLLTVSHMVRL